MEESLPNITGGNIMAYNNNDNGTGAFTAYLSEWQNMWGTNDHTRVFYFNASLSSPVYQNNAHVRPNSLECSFCIRY